MDQSDREQPERVPPHHAREVEYPYVVLCSATDFRTGGGCWVASGHRARTGGGLFINSVIDFVIIAFCVFLLTKIAMKPGPPAPVPPTKECPQPAGLRGKEPEAMSRHHTHFTAAIVAVVAAMTGAAGAQEAPASERKLPKWSDAADLGWVATSGNSESNSFSFKDTLLREGKNDLFELKLGGLRVETTDIRLYAVGTSTAFSREEEKETRTTAENYALMGRYDRNITEKFFWVAGAGWERDEFAGIQNRYVGFGGVGHNWFNTDRRKWRTDYSVTRTKQENVVDDPDFDETFFGVRLSSTFLQKFGDQDVGTFGNDTIIDIDENLSLVEEWRVNMTNWVTLNISRHLALKVSLQWLYDHMPSLKEVDLFPASDPGGTGTPIGTVLVDLEDLDTLFTTALVIKY